MKKIAIVRKILVLLPFIIFFIMTILFFIAFQLGIREVHDHAVPIGTVFIFAIRATLIGNLAIMSNRNRFVNTKENPISIPIKMLTIILFVLYAITTLLMFAFDKFVFVAISSFVATGLWSFISLSDLESITVILLFLTAIFGFWVEHQAAKLISIKKI